MLALQSVAAPVYHSVQIGQVTVIAPAARMGLGVALGEQADQPASWPGLGRRFPGPLRLVLAPDRAAFRRLSRERIPNWGVGLAVPGARTVVILADASDPGAALRHELAHLALHDAVRVRVPLWFDEGYAVVAAREVDRFAALQLNLAVARGRVGDFRALDAALRQSAGEAEAAYALAGSAVLYLARLHPSGTLDSLMGRLQNGSDFGAAVLGVTGYDLGRVELAWQRDLRRRYNIFVWLAAGGGWAIVALVVVGLTLLRRRRDRPRRARLDEGWIVPPESPDVVDPAGEGE